MPQRVASNSDKRLKSGGRAKYLLSGLLICNVCKAHYVIADARSYACSGHWNGGACSNHIRVRRDAIEHVILGGVRRDLSAPCASGADGSRDACRLVSLQ